MTIEETETMNLPPLETPVLKVSRPVAACSRCRNAKIKCDGKLPACSSCEKNGRAAECTSTNDQFARGKERSYVSTLETRLDKIQARLDEARARKPSVIDVPEEESATAAPSRRPSRHINPNEPPTPTTSRLMQRKEVTAMDDLVSDFGFLSVNATARDFYGFTTAMSYARLILSACSKDELPQGLVKALPPRQTATMLIQHYMDNIFVLLPVLDEAMFYASVDNVYLKGFRQADALDHWMVRMVLAVATSSRSQQRGDPQYMDGIGHVCAALDHAEAVLHPGNISGVQALFLLTQYAMLDPHHFDSWGLIGAASRAMTDLGLHQDPPKGTPMPRGKLELRRRVFHCIYTLDRSTSLVQTRAFSFSDNSAKVKIPFHKQPNSAPTSPAANGSQPHRWLHSYEHALDLINLRKFQSVWYAELFQSGRTPWEESYPFLWDTCDEMRKWFEELSPTMPAHLHRFFELDLFYSYVYVLSPSPRVPTIHPFAQRLIFEYCMRYAEMMTDLISDPAYTAPLTFYDAMRVYMTGRQFLDVLLHNTDMLLSGTIPPHPEVKPTTAPPPPVPVPRLPPGQTVQHFNIIRSINCITQITTCLERLGVRFGYMSWNQRYRNETTATLDILRQRLREYDEVGGPRRPSMWHGGSIGSNPSSNGSFAYHSPQQHTSQTTIGYAPHHQQSSPPSVRPASGYVEPQISQGQYGQQPAMQQYNMPPQYNQTQQSYNRAQQPQFAFNEPVYRAPAYSAAPNQQFAAWGGYGGTSMPVEEENPAMQMMNVPQPKAAGSTMPPPSVDMGQRAPSPRAPIYHSGPNRQASLVSPTGQGDARMASLVPLDSHGNSIYSGNMPRTSEQTSFSDMAQWYEHKLALQDPARRTSMHDAALDVLQATYPPSYTSHYHTNVVNPWQQPPPAQTYVGKGKGRAQDAPAQPPPPPPPPPQPQPCTTCPGGFDFHDGIGFVCIVCSRICPHPAQHRTLPNGGGCVDMGGAAMPCVHQPQVQQQVQQQPQMAQMAQMGQMGAQNVVPQPAMPGVQNQVPQMQIPVQRDMATGVLQTPGGLFMMPGNVQPQVQQQAGVPAGDVMMYGQQGLEERRVSEGAGLFF